jgi:oligoendopeptidase F
MYKEKSWNLSEITPKSINGAFAAIERKTKKIEQKRKLLKDTISPTTFMQIVKELEQLKVQSAKLSVSVHLTFCENVNNQQATALMSKVETFLAKIGNRLLFFSLWFKHLPEKKAKQLIAASDKYHYHFEMLRKTKKHMLKENEEQIINLKDTTGVSALTNVYNILTAQFVYVFQGKRRTQEEMVTYVRSTSATVRQEAYQSLLAPYKKQKDVIGEIYKNIINDWREESVGLRKYKNPINVRNVANDMPDKAIEAMLRVCDRNQKVFHTFFELKRKKLGLKKLRRYDLYAPLKEEKATIPYDKAVQMVLETFAGFHPRFHKYAEHIITGKHVHSKVQQGKRSGAFCCPVSTQVAPYVLLSYTGKYRDVSTLAHELGHGIHFMLSASQTEFTHDACLPLAETASIFSEMLLSEKMLRENQDAAKAMLFTKIDDLYASISRQAGFVRFEEKAHEMMREGKTIEEMSDEYLKMLKKQLGSKIEVDNIYRYEWAYIPHIFHTPFYCYAYAFGNLLTLALYAMYKKQGKPFADKVVKMLSKGGSESPVKIAKIVGADITSEKFWEQGFTVVKEMVKQVM